MAKTKFLSKVLAVLMALSMLCSTGVFADYNSGLTAGDAAVTGTITATGTKLNGEIAFWSADTEAEAKWFDVADGLTLQLGGTTDAATGTITYVVAPVGVLEQEPLDVATMEAQSVAIGTADIVGGEFNFTIEADKAKLAKNTTYELRLAYSKTEIADVTDASALVYQRYLKSFDWADATTKATRVINKEGIGDITIDIESNPLRDAVIAAKVTNEAQRNNAIASPTHIRSANLKSGDVFNYSSSDYIPADFKWAGEDVKAVTTATQRQSMVVEVGKGLQGGVMLALPTAEVERYYGEGVQQRDNAAYRFKATNSGTVYLLGSGTPNRTGWTEVTEGAGAVDGYYDYGSRNYLYVANEVTDDMLTAAGVDSVNAYLAANTSLAVRTADAAGYYRGGSKAWTGIGDRFYAAGLDGYISAQGYFQLPSNNLDENGNWIMKNTGKPYSMGAVTLYNYTTGRGYLTQARTFAYTYVREFEAGEWVEIPYDSASGGSAKNAAVIQFDVPVTPLASASVTTTKAAVFSDALPMLAGEAVAFEGENYEIVVPRGTETVSFTVANVNGAESDAVTATMDAASKVVKATIGDAEYDITVKYDDAYPTIYNYKNNSSYDKHNRIAIQYGDMGTPTVGGKKTNAPDGSALTSLAFANGAVKPALTKDLLVIGTYDNRGQAHMTGFDWKEKTRADGMTFNVSKGATVYVKSVARGNVGSPSLEAADFDQVGTLENYPLYAKHFNAGEAVSIPTEPVTQAELDAYNATLTGTKRWAFVDDTNKNLKLDDGTTAIPAGAVGLPIQWNIDAEGNLVSAVNNSSSAGRPTYYTRGQSTTFYVEFDTPLALGEVTYSVDGGDADAITFAEGEFTKTIEVPYNATTVSVAATKTGTGTVTVEPAELDLTGVASGTVTVTLAAPGAEPIVYTINFVKGAPKILWESKLALTDTPKTQNQGANRNLHANGLYNVGAQSGSLDLTATELDLVVPYGVEVVELNGEVSVNLLAAENHAATATVTINGTDYTVNVSWAAYEYKEGMPRLYDLEYGVTGVYNTDTKAVDEFDKTGLYDTNWYYAIPTSLVLDAEHDLVLGTGDLIGTKDGEVTVNKLEGTWFTSASHQSVNLTSTSAGAGVNRLHLAPSAFESWVENGDLDDIYVLNGATMLVANYTDVVANNAVRYKFKAAHAGYVIVACNEANSNFAAADGWTRLGGNTMRFTNGSTSAQGTALANPPEGHTNSAKGFAEWSGACNYIYMKKVAADEVIEIKESNVTSGYPPVVIVATEDMINERIVAPTVLESLSYTTALAVTEPKESVGANGHSAASLHANGFYQPTLVTEAETVAVAADATTVTVTVPYGSEIVNLAGVDNYDGAVAFDAINLINNNGAATVTKTVGEVTYTINVAWAAYDASADPAGNMVYDVKYRIKDLANTTYYNIVPTKLVLTENRIDPMDVDGYTINKSGAYVLEHAAGEWYNSKIVGGAGSNLLTHKNGAAVGRGRATLVAFDGWVRNGLVTASGVPGAALPAEATDAEVDAIAYAAMNGATTLVAHYQDYTSLATAAGANAAMAEHLTFKVAQDSIVYVSTTSTDIGTGWTKFNAGKLYLHNQTNSAIYGKNEDDTYTQLFTSSFINLEYSAGSHAFYRYAKAGDTVSLTLNKAENDMPPVVLVRPIDFSGFEAPTMGAITYKIGSGEATAVEFAEGETTATIEVPWGTTDAISLQAALASGQGGVSVSDALTLSPETSEGAITVALTDVLGNEVASYTVNFVWGAAPEVEAITYSTARTLYKGAVEKDAVLGDETEITVPWGTASVTVSYKMEGADAVALDAVSFVDGAATVEVPLPTGTVTYTFTYGAAPAGQYVTELTKYVNNYSDRYFVSAGTDTLASMSSGSKYGENSEQFFAADKMYSARVPEGLAKKGYTAVIADATANTGHGNMPQSKFPYLNDSYPATEGAENAWMSFKVAKDGMAYASVAREDGVWTEIEALGWTEAPFTMQRDNTSVKVYQKPVTAGETVYLPNSQFDDEEMTYVNNALAAKGAGYRYAKLTSEDVEAIQAKATAEGKTVYNLGAGWAQQNVDENGNPDLNSGYYNGFRASEKESKYYFNYYQRPNASVVVVVDEANVDDAARAPQYKGATTLAADGSIELSAIPAAYGEKTDDEITFAIKSGAEYASLEGNVLTADRKAWVEGATVVIEITQGELTTEVAIAIDEVAENKYGTIEVYQAEGRGAVTAYLGDDPEAVVVETSGTIDEAAGAIVTFSATPAEGYKFLYWALVDAEGNVITAYTYAPEFKMNVGYNLKIKAVFATDNPDVYTVTFKGWQGNIIEQFTVEKDAEGSFNTPYAPNVYGYKFDHYEAEDWINTYAENAEIQKNMIASDVTFVAKYVPDETLAEYTVTVEGGTVDGAESKSFAYNKPVTVIAAEAEEGKKFSHWTEGDKIVSYDAEYDFYMASADRNLVAVYVDAEAAVVPAPVITMTVTEVDMEAANGPIYGLFAERRVPEAYTVVENGIIWGIAEDEANAENINWENVNVTAHPQGASTSKYQNNNGQYTVRLQMTATRQGKGDKWYARTYLIYKDTDGSIKTKYSAPALVWEKEAAAPEETPEA